MWLYAFASNLAWMGWASLVISMILILYIIVDRFIINSHNPIDLDDAERVISYSLKLLVFGVVVISIPSQEHLVKVEHEFMVLTYEMYGSRLKELEVIQQKQQTEKMNEEIPAMLKRECTGRVCR